MIYSIYNAEDLSKFTGKMDVYSYESFCSSGSKQSKGTAAPCPGDVTVNPGGGLDDPIGGGSGDPTGGGNGGNNGGGGTWCIATMQTVLICNNPPHIGSCYINVVTGWQCHTYGKTSRSRTSTDCPDIDFDFAGVIPVPVLRKINSCVNNSLTNDEISWLTSNANEAAAINNFINENTCTPEVSSFTKEAIKALMDGNEVDFEDKIITVLPECLNNIFNKLKVVANGKISEIFSKFRGNNPVPENYNWKVVTGSCSNGASACTNPSISNGTSFTKIDTLTTKNATDFSMARTFIHEAIHAYLVSVYRFRNIDKNYVTLMKEFAKDYNNNANDIHHRLFIEENLIDPIGQALYDWANLSGYYNVPGGLNYFKELAWGGLTHYRDANGNYIQNPNFINLVPNPDVRTRIVQISEAELLNQPSGVNNPKGQKACN